ncbi:hypothetical protein PFMALIP_02396 [Plasmodium falciparum MaliPS096_E11]|uniref:Uncharacterized protein n=1 Tax=Plasmodium falciparum MaliPS096_E11 TaxID=1036727 RepID=A0A024WR98_PLAFA|nr:hypothetical protein PFMALIP_02396 [Plasmodium falciparum MaliPS096_E11]
MYNFKHLHLI